MGLAKSKSLRLRLLLGAIGAELIRACPFEFQNWLATKSELRFENGLLRIILEANVFKSPLFEHK